MNVTPRSISAQIAKGKFVPHTGLTRMALAYYQNASNYFAKSIFPVCKVDLSADQYYVFDKEDLLKDGWQRKPAYGKVNPVVLSEHTENYAVTVDQMIMGIDEIRQTDLGRRQAPRQGPVFGDLRKPRGVQIHAFPLRQSLQHPFFPESQQLGNRQRSDDHCIIGFPGNVPVSQLRRRLLPDEQCPDHGNILP